MAKHDPKIAEDVALVLPNCGTISEQEFLAALNPVIVGVEKDDTYSTKAKLKIFSLLTMACNVEPKERKKYMKKVAKAVK